MKNPQVILVKVKSLHDPVLPARALALVNKELDQLKQLVNERPWLVPFRIEFYKEDYDPIRHGDNCHIVED